MDSNFWWCVELECDAPEAEAEEILSTLADLSGSIGAELLEEDGTVIMRAAYISSRDIGHWLSLLDELAGHYPGTRVRSHSKLENRPWHTEHLDSFPPLAVGVDLVVSAPWHRGKEPEEKASKEKIPIYIYPSSAFGTGYHESTRIALSLTERFVKPGDTVVDVGTGSGVLFIAALKLGAAYAAARDVDPTAIAEAKRNMELNGIPGSRCDLRTGDLLEGVGVKADVLMSNILLEPNLRLLRSLAAAAAGLAPSGVAIFSGMTLSERGAFLSALPEAGLSLWSEMTENEWWGCAAKFAG